MLTTAKLFQPIDKMEKAREDSRLLWDEITDPGANRRGADFAACLPLKLSGRYHVGDGNEFPCEIREISPLGITLKGSKEGALGQPCTANIAHIGIVEGVVVRVERDALVLGIIALPIRLQRLARRLRWHFKRLHEPAQDRRASERIEMKSAQAVLRTVDGRTYPCAIFDISEGGAALHLGPNALYVWADQPIEFDHRPGRVLRHFPGGVVIKFD